MKRTLFALLAISAVTFCACSSIPSGATPAASPAATAIVNVSAMDTVELTKVILDKERKTWELAQNKQREEFKKLLALDYRAVFDDGFYDANQDAEALLSLELKEYAWMDEKVTFPLKDTAILTYKTISKAAYKGKDVSGTYYYSAVWVKQGEEWKRALLQETKAVPQPKK